MDDILVVEISETPEHPIYDAELFSFSEVYTYTYNPDEIGI